MSGSALPLITISDDGQFLSHPDTIKLLRTQKKNIGVVCVAGLYRTGKSYLLNLLTKTSVTEKGFAVGSTVNACTKGIWIWSEPIYDEEKNIWVYYLDTEGLGSTSRSETHDSRMFALSILLSSYFIYNSRGVIDNQALEDLSLVVNITQTIKVKSSSSSSAGTSGGKEVTSDSRNKEDKSQSQSQSQQQSLSDHFPSFLWVLRDFSLKLVDDKGQRISSHTYFENCLLPQTGFSDGVDAKNRIRNLITECFIDRDCVALVRPVEDEEILRHLSDHPLSDLRPEFQKQMEHLLSKIAKNVRPKTVLGRTINGEMFCSLLESYVEAMNSGGAPEIKSAWTRVVANQCREAQKQALRVYDQLLVTALRTFSDPPSNSDIDSSTDNQVPSGSGSGAGLEVSLLLLLPADTQVLLDCHEKAKSKSKEFFRTQLMDPEDETAKQAAASFKQDLRRRLTATLRANRQASREASFTSVQTLMDSLASGEAASFSSSSSNSGTNSAGGVDIANIRAALAVYSDALAGVEATVGPQSRLGSEGKAVVCSKMSSDFIDRLMFWASTVADAFRKSENILQTSIHKLELNLATLTATAEAKQALLTSQLDNDDRAATALKEKIEIENLKFIEISTIKQGEISRYENMLNDLGLMHQTSITSLEKRIAEYRERLKTERDTVLEEQRKLGAGKSALKAESRSADDAREEEMEQLGESVTRQEAHIATLSQEVRDLDKQHREDMNKKSQEQLNETNILSRNMENEIDVLMTQLKADSRRDHDNKTAEVKRMQDMIKQKETQLMQLGVDPGESLTSLSSLRQNGSSSVLGETQAHSGDTTHSQGKTKTNKSSKKKQGSCQQS